jgi:hypothetical protein
VKINKALWPVLAGTLAPKSAPETPKIFCELVSYWCMDKSVEGFRKYTQNFLISYRGSKVCIFKKASKVDWIVSFFKFCYFLYFYHASNREGRVEEGVEDVMGKIPIVAATIRTFTHNVRRHQKYLKSCLLFPLLGTPTMAEQRKYQNRKCLFYLFP